MAADVEMLPEPRYPVGGEGDEDSYNSGWNDCLAECRQATAAQAAEIEALREEVERLKELVRSVGYETLTRSEQAEARAERLAEAARTGEDILRYVHFDIGGADKVRALLREQEEGKA